MISITSHSANEDVSDEAEAFVAFGTLGQFHTVDSVTMNNIAADFVEEDWQVLPPTWTAFFPPLGQGTYTLQALDSKNHSSSVSGLQVN